MSEVWRPVVGSGGLYQVSNEGRVRSFKKSHTPSLMALQFNRGGYPHVCLTLGGKEITVVVHRLVLAAFVGPRSPGEEIRHLDGVRTNNNLSNLVYGTSAENAQDSLAHGTNRQTRKTHCPSGHPYDASNTRVYKHPRGGIKRFCRACQTARNRARRKGIAA